MDISLRVTNVSKFFSTKLFEEVTLNVQSPSKIALIGDNGSGKSTFLKMLAGQESVSIGEILWGQEARVGYLEQELGTDLDTASGGEKKIIKLSQLFYGGYNVLLLDEPDNHLDLANRAWFSSLVEDFEGTLVIISHDRKFLRKSVDRIWLLEEETIADYPFNYEKFADVYGDTMTARTHLWEVQEKERKRLEALVKEYQRRASMSRELASAYKSMIKRYDRFTAEMVKKPPESKTVGLSTKTEKQPERKTALYLKNLSKSYGENSILKDLSLHVFCGEKIAISAPNGSGKSTLLNIISGNLDFNSGEVYLGPGLKIGYYTQDHLASLDENATLVEEAQKGVGIDQYRAVGYLKKFLFTDAQIRSQVKYLSGGQKSRLQLEKFLLEYPGTVILVSHDLELVEKVTEKVYLLEGGELRNE